MNAPLLPERLLARPPADGEPAQQPLPLASPGVQRIVWDSRWGRMLIEVEGDAIRVNGRPVEPVSSPPAPRTPRS